MYGAEQLGEHVFSRPVDKDYPILPLKSENHIFRWPGTAPPPPTLLCPIYKELIPKYSLK